MFDAALNFVNLHSFELFVMVCLAAFVELAAREMRDMPTGDGDQVLRPASTRASWAGDTGFVR
jgi:hypothetical protein